VSSVNTGTKNINLLIQTDTCCCNKQRIPIPLWRKVNFEGFQKLESTNIST